MNVIFDILDLAAIACYFALAALLFFHLLNCWQQLPVPAIATAGVTIDRPATLLVPSITPTASVAPEPTPIGDIATAPAVKRRRQASSAKGFSKRQSVTT